MKLDHVGWVTNNQGLFEHFWCRGLGFERVWEANIMVEKTRTLFRWDGSTRAIRYKKGDMVIEIHVFDPPITGENNEFVRFGINHIGLWVEDREQFIKDLEDKLGYVEVKRYWDPSGWWNIFIRDYEGNWIELRTTL